MEVGIVMEATIENLNDVKKELGIELILLRQKYYNRLGSDGCTQMFQEIDKKLLRMLPGYDLSISAKEAFGDVISRTAASFALKY